MKLQASPFVLCSLYLAVLEVGCQAEARAWKVREALSLEVRVSEVLWFSYLLNIHSYSHQIYVLGSLLHSIWRCSCH